MTENISLRVGAGDRLVGVTTFCNYPEEARPCEDRRHDDAEYGDDLDAQAGYRFCLDGVADRGIYEKFEENGIAVYVTNPTSLG